MQSMAGKIDGVLVVGGRVAAANDCNEQRVGRCAVLQSSSRWRSCMDGDAKGGDAQLRWLGTIPRQAIAAQPR